MPEIRRGDIPPALWPLWDQLNLELQRVVQARLQLERARRWMLVAVVGNVTALVLLAWCLWRVVFLDR